MLTRSLSRWPTVKAETCRGIDSIVQQVMLNFTYYQKLFLSQVTLRFTAAFEVRHCIVGKGKSNLEFLKEAWLACAYSRTFWSFQNKGNILKRNKDLLGCWNTVKSNKNGTKRQWESKKLMCISVLFQFFFWITKGITSSVRKAIGVRFAKYKKSILQILLYKQNNSWAIYSYRWRQRVFMFCNR
jgi:hypothetical protein